MHAAWVTLALWGGLVSAIHPAPRADVLPPHIVVILADDLGYGDLRCNNPTQGKISTPQLDRLAAEGMRFTDAHSSSGVCSPSRYTLLTGRYHWRTRLQAGIVNYLDPPLIGPSRWTLGTLCQSQGYRTACIGKWHLGWDWQISKEDRALFAPPRNPPPSITPDHLAAWNACFSKPIGGGPTTRGFDVYFGTDVPNWPPYTFIDQDRTVGIPNTFLPADQLRDHLASLPGPAREDWQLNQVLPTITERACQFVETEVAAGNRFLLYFSLTSPHTPLAVNEAWQGRSGLGSRVADLVMETDDAVGSLLATLEDLGISDQTLVIFTSDNGFAPYVGARHLEQQGHMPSGPLRGYKGDAWEGGHRVPFLVRWPGHVAAGTTCEALVHHADVMATIAELIDVVLPDDAGEDSFSLVPLFQDPTGQIRRQSVSQGQRGLFSIRDGTWKLLLGSGGGGAWSEFSAEPRTDAPGQLYDLANDLGETRNLFDQYPERVDRLKAELETIVENGRSRPGPRQPNAVPVRWNRMRGQ